MLCFVPSDRTDPRAALTPEAVSRLAKLGLEISIETGLGAGMHAPDERYEKAGAKITQDRKAAFAAADLVLRMQKPDEVDALRPGSIHISYLDPFNNASAVQALAARGVSAISLEMIPRITRAQKMDVLSSQANLAGYVSVVLAAEYSSKIFPMMMTAAGTLTAAKVLVVGAGVAGLQAIATARRLGARVSAYDTRPVVEEQVKSLVATFVKIDIGETGQTAGGYAKALTEEQLQKQRDALKKVCVESDAVITTAQVFGRKAPVIITTDILAAMKPGAVVVDGAIESGGNVEGAVMNQVTEFNGVRVVAFPNLAGRVPVHASQVFSANMTALVEEFWDKDAKKFVLRTEDEIMKSCLITHGGEIVHPDVKARLAGTA
jgi:NAD(P) transhydrogenase subunit alpha